MKKSDLKKLIKEEIKSALNEESSNATAVYADYKDVYGMIDGIINAINSLGIGYAQEDESTVDSDTLGIIIGRSKEDVERYQEEIYDQFDN